MADNRKAEKIIKFFDDKDVTIEILTFSESTRTCADAAAAVGCQVGEIVKSLVLRSGDTPLLFLVSGENRVNLNALRPQFDNQLKMHRQIR